MLASSCSSPGAVLFALARVFSQSGIKRVRRMPFRANIPGTPRETHPAANPALEGKQNSPSPESITAQLTAVCRSAGMSLAPRLAKLLTFLVEETQAGNPLKESIVGVSVFGRAPGYDPKQDSVVRTEVRRLRTKLVEYYAGEGAGDRLIIDLPKGSYVPVFRERQIAPPEHRVAEPAAIATANGSPPGRWSDAQQLRAVLAAILILMIGLFAGWRAWHARSSAGAASIAEASRRSVAVLDFRDLTGRRETAWLANAIPEMISADLAAGSQVRTIPGENVLRMETELALQPTATPSATILSAIRRNLGADIVISGAYADLGTQDGGQVRLDIRAQDARTGEVIASVSESGRADEILAVVSRAGTRLRDGLQLEVSSLGDEAARQATPANPGAARAYSDGLALLRRGNLFQARILLQECLRIDPNFAPGHAALSDADSRLGYESQARDEARRAYELSSGLSGEETRLAIEAQYRMTNAEPNRAAEIYARLLARHPDDIEVGLQLAEAQRKADRTADALQTIQDLRNLPAPESQDPRIDIAAVYAMANRADYRQGAALAADAARKASAAGARLLYAHAISLESGLDWYLGDARWRVLSEEARGICEQLGDKGCVAAIFRRMGNADFAALDLEGADRNFAQALAIAREIGSLAEETNVLNGMALVSHARANLTHAEEIDDRLLAIGRQTGNLRLEQASQANLADTLLEEGRIDAAYEKVETATSMARAVGDRAAIADDLVSLAELERIRGDLVEADKTCREGLALSRETSSINTEISAFAERTRILLAADDLAGAQAAFEEYERLRKSGVDVSVFADRSLPVEMALAAGQSALAATLAEALVRETAAQGITVDQGRAEALLGKALLSQGKSAEARTAVESAWGAVRGSQLRLARLEISITLARVTGRPGLLPDLVSEAHSIHVYELELEARMAAAQLSGKTQELAALRREALSHGFKYMARSAITNPEFSIE